MKAECFEIDTGGHLHSVGLADAVARWRSGSGVFWIDVEAPDIEERSGLLVKLGLDLELIDHFLEHGHAARVVPFDDGLFFELPIEISGQPAELKSAEFVCLDRLVVTIRGGFSESSSWIDAMTLPRLTLEEGSTTSLVCALLIGLSVNLRHRSLDVRKALAEYSDRLDEDPASVPLHEILALKRRIFDLDAISEERAAALESLRAIKRPFLDLVQSADTLRVALGNTAATSRRLDRLDRRTAGLQVRYDAAQQEKINRRLSRLTIISAIFLPLTLIAGIYGMNFEVMPELQYPLAYPLTMVGMVVIALGLLWWFRSRGWMD